MAVENIDILEQSLGLEKGKLTEMITSEDKHTLEFDKYVIKPKSDYDDLLNNIKKESSTAAVEIAIKNARNELGLDFQGKTMENLLKSYAEKIEAEAKVDPNKKYDSLKSDFDKLQGNLKEWETKYTTLESTYKQKEQASTIKNTLLKEIPENTLLDKEDILALAMAKYQFGIDEDGFAISKEGVLLKNDSNMNRITPSEFMKTFITPYLKPIDGGAGGKDSTGGNKETSLELFNKKMESKGININSQKYNEEMKLAMSNGTLKL